MREAGERWRRARASRQILRRSTSTKQKKSVLARQIERIRQLSDAALTRLFVARHAKLPRRSVRRREVCRNSARPVVPAATARTRPGESTTGWYEHDYQWSRRVAACVPLPCRRWLLSRVHRGLVPHLQGARPDDLPAPRCPGATSTCSTARCGSPRSSTRPAIRPGTASPATSTCATRRSASSITTAICTTSTAGASASTKRALPPGARDPRQLREVQQQLGWSAGRTRSSRPSHWTWSTPTATYRVATSRATAASRARDAVPRRRRLLLPAHRPGDLQLVPRVRRERPRARRHQLVLREPRACNEWCEHLDIEQRPSTRSPRWRGVAHELPRLRAKSALPRDSPRASCAPPRGKDPRAQGGKFRQST